MTMRAGPNKPSFTDTVCEATIPPDTTAAGVSGHSLPVMSENPRRIALVGDTGCAHSKGQDCDDPNATAPNGWPFAEVARSVAREHPDLIIHLGDILYRNSKSACPTGCSADIDADFFTPAAPMLAAAPLVMVRGNHEAFEKHGSDCVAWFRYFAFDQAVQTCEAKQRFTEPYRIRLTAHQELIVLDTSAAPDNNPDDIREYRDELRQANALATQPAWLISHVPLWYVAKKGNEGGPGILERALKDAGGRLSATFRMVISGHLHQFEYLSLSVTRQVVQQVPAQLILGDGGTKMSDPLRVARGMDVDPFNHVKVVAGGAEKQFGYGVIALEAQDTSADDPKSITINFVDGSMDKTCSLLRVTLRC